MDEQFQALPMSGQFARAAYPLVYLHDASVSLEDWLRFVRRIGRSASSNAVLIAIRDCRGIVPALFSHRVSFALRPRKRLCITHLVVAHLAGSAIGAALAARAGDIAANLDCQSISIEQPFAPRPDLLQDCSTADFAHRRGASIPFKQQH